jgi:TP901 family phage tail tape measure protein
VSLQAAALYALVSVAGADKSISDLGRVSGAVNRTQGVMAGLAKNGAQIGRGVGQVAGGLFRVAEVATAAVVGLGVEAAKTSMDFEDAFATVEKTVEGTPQALDAIDQGLRKLSTSIPVTFQELTSIASEAGALGVATKDIESFTEAVARTSAATVGLDPFMASEAFGKLSTIFSLHGDQIDKVTGQVVSDYDRLGSALVALGNAGASSEAEIIDVSKYFAGAGQAAGLSAAQVLAWGSALTSLGMEPEAGGGALQRVFQRLTTNIGTMTDPAAAAKVKKWAETAGMGVKDFVKLFRDDASGAVIKFLGGLKELDNFQGAAALKDAGIINQRDIRAILTLSQHIPVLTDQLDISTKAWDENTALMEVSEKRFDTLKAHVTELTNDLKVGAAAVGDGMNPALDNLTKKAKAFLDLHMGDLENLGKNIGQAIDDIDWAQVNRGLSTAVDLAQALFGFIKMIPPEILGGVAAFDALNRVSGGLLGRGAGNIVGGAIGMVGTLARGALLSILPPGVRNIVAGATVMHVWVDNMPGGGILGAPGSVAGGGSGSWGSALKFMGALGLATVAVELFANVLGPLNDRIATMTTDIGNQVHNDVTFKSKGDLEAERQVLLDGLNGIFATTQNLGPLRDVLYGGQIAGLRAAIADIDRELGNRSDERPGTRPGVRSGGMSLEDRDADYTRRHPAGTSGLDTSTLTDMLKKAIYPIFTDPEREAALQRGRDAGYKPKGGAAGDAVTATLQRDFVREAQRQIDATNGVKLQELQTTAAVMRASDEIAGLRQSGNISIAITIPGAKSYTQVINETRPYGPSVPNQQRKHFNGGGI